MVRRGNRRREDPVERRARARARAGQTLRWLGRLTLALALGAGTVASVAGAGWWAVHTPRFAVREVHFEGNERAPLEGLAPLTGLSNGQNLFRVDTEAAERNLASHPWVAAAAVRRELPGTVRIAVREHVPAALAVLDEVVYLVSDEGIPFKRLTPGDPSELPVVTGLEGVVDDRGLLRDRLKEALSVLEVFEASSVSAGGVLAEVNLDPVRGVGLTVLSGTERRPTVAHLGHEDLPRRLARLDQLLKRLAERREHPEEVFLDNHARPRWVVARVE